MAKKKQEEDAKKQADEIIQAAREEANRLKNEAIREIQNEKNNAIAALRRQVSGLSVQIASKILEKQVDDYTKAVMYKDAQIKNRDAIIDSLRYER